jgi:membrane-associated phospholipid phosphatase
MPTPLDALGSDLARAFGGTNLIWYAGAVGASVAMAESGADESIRNAGGSHFASRSYGRVATLTGYILPAALAPGVWVTGLAAGDRRAAGAGSAAVQALVVTTLTVGVLKVGVGRNYPEAGTDTLHPFQTWTWPFAAWPSGHTSASMSVVSALTAYYGSAELWIPLVGYSLTTAIAIGMVSGEEHWASDLIAGAVIGQCIGWSIGRAFRARERGQELPGLSFVPLVGTSRGIAIEGTW